MREGMGQPGKHLLTATAKVWRFGLGRKILVFCSDYNAPTLFQNLQNRYLAFREHGTHQTHHPLWSIVRLSVL